MLLKVPFNHVSPASVLDVHAGVPPQSWRVSICVSGGPQGWLQAAPTFAYWASPNCCSGRWQGPHGCGGFTSLCRELTGFLYGSPFLSVLGNILVSFLQRSPLLCFLFHGLKFLFHRGWIFCVELILLLSNVLDFFLFLLLCILLNGRFSLLFHPFSYILNSCYF